MAIKKPVMPSATDVLANGGLSVAGTHYLDDLGNASASMIAQLEALAVETWSWFIESPEDKDYDLIINLAYPGDIESITTDCTAGTATFTGKINTTALGGTANSVSTTEQTQAHTSANSFVAGDNFRGTVSSNSGCENMTVTVKVRRTF
jgi:hypothetical protein